MTYDMKIEKTGTRTEFVCVLDVYDMAREILETSVDVDDYISRCAVSDEEVDEYVVLHTEEEIVSIYREGDFGKLVAYECAREILEMRYAKDGDKHRASTYEEMKEFVKAHTEEEILSLHWEEVLLPIIKETRRITFQNKFGKLAARERVREVLEMRYAKDGDKHRASTYEEMKEFVKAHTEEEILSLHWEEVLLPMENKKRQNILQNRSKKGNIMNTLKIPISAILIPYYEDIGRKKRAGWSWKMIIAALKQDIEVTEDIAKRLTPRLMPTMYGQLRPHDVPEDRKRTLPEIIKYRE